MSASFLPFPTRFFSRKSRSKRAKTSTPDNLAQPTSVVPLTSSQHGPLRTAPAHHSHTQGYAASRQTSASIRSAPHTTDTYNPRRYGDSYLPRKIPSLNELQRRAAVTSPPPRPHARQVFNGREMSDQPSSMAGRFTPWNGAPQHMPYSRGQREEAWRSRRFSEQPSHPLVSVPLSRAASVDGHHALEPPWNGVVAASIEEESESDQEGPLGPLEVLEAFFNEEPMPEWIILPSPPTSPRASSPPAPSPVPMAAQPAPPPPFPPPRPPFPPPPPPSSSPPPPPSAVRARSRTPQLHSDRQQLQPITPPRRQSSAAVDGGTAAYEVAVNGHVPTHASSLTAANSTSSPASSQSAASRSPFSLPRLRRNSSRASKLEGPSNPPSPAHDDEWVLQVLSLTRRSLPYHQRPLPPTPPERGDSFRNRLLRNRRRSGDATLPDSIQEEEIEHPLAQLSDALRLSPAPRPVSLVAYIIPPEERAQIGRHRRGSWSSTSSMSDSVYSPHNLSLPTPQSSPQPMPISPFRSTFSPPTGLNPPPRPRSSMVSTRSAGSSNHHAWSPPTTTRTSSTLRPSPMLHDDPIAQW